MKQIPLTRGKFALVDDADFEWLNKWKWSASKHRNTWYAVRMIEWKKPTRMVYMHRSILDLPENIRCDHKNRYGLDNQRQNLRCATASQNSFNQGIRSNNKSGFKGVSWNSHAGKWQVFIRGNGVRLYLGIYASIKKAAFVYDDAAKLLHGDFARLNFP